MNIVLTYKFFRKYWKTTYAGVGAKRTLITVINSKAERQKALKHWVLKLLLAGC
ncbi:MAG: hypothetical protein M3Z92_05610 [Bacteroidota bacterium]|nr:hypothetical protein [Bacteroidota bacterium]